MRGFTLVELLFVVAIAALLLTIGAPSLQSAVKNSHMTSSVNQLVASLQLARSEALKRRVPVSLCATLSAGQNQPGCDADADWEDGWIAFVDDNGDGRRDAGEDIIRTERKLQKDIDVTTPADQPMQNSVTYLPSGFPDVGGLDAAGLLLFCDDRRSNRLGRVVAVPQTGRPVTTSVAERPELMVSCE